VVSPLHRSNSGYVDTDSDGVSERGVCVKGSAGGGGSTWNTKKHGRHGGGRGLPAMNISDLQPSYVTPLSIHSYGTLSPRMKDPHSTHYPPLPHSYIFFGLV